MKKIMEINMVIDKPARKSGGDRYAGKLEETEITFYVPQNVSRPEGTPLPSFKLTLEV